MKRHLESPEESDRKTKRSKIEEKNDQQLFPNEILEIILKNSDVRSKAQLLQSAKFFERILDEETWKSFYVLRWHKKVLGENDYNSEELMEEIEQHLSVSPNDYVEEQFYNKKHAWKNRYKHRARLEHEGRKPEFELCADLYEIDENSLTIFEIDHNGDIQYSNVDNIEEFNRQLIIRLHQRRGNLQFQYEGENKLENNCDAYHAILIGHTGAPVKIRVESVRVRTFYDVAVKKLYCNCRLLAYNAKNQIWDVISAQYSNFAIEEDQIYYYKPYCNEFCNALFVNETSAQEGRGQKQVKYYDGDLYKFAAAAADVSEDFRGSNTDDYININNVALEDEENLEEDDEVIDE